MTNDNICQLCMNLLICIEVLYQSIVGFFLFVCFLFFFCIKLCLYLCIGLYVFVVISGLRQEPTGTSGKSVF